jgi:hypothetical protein
MPSARRRTTAYTALLFLALSQLLLAWVLPHEGCEWTFGVYAVMGAAVTLLCVATPYAQRRAFARHLRAPVAMSFGLLAVLAWMGGWYMAFSGLSC